ncbi:MAG: BON domain-containing protein [Chloroflexi bacterium]|nr:BON domain-containing protein [Chloroflexota bacterium]
MASSEHAATNGSRSDTSLKDRLKTAYTMVQSFRPDESGARARTWLRLHKMLGAEAGGIHVTASGGWMELRGDVTSREVGAKAVEIAKATPGVRGVLDFLRVR